MESRVKLDPWTTKVKGTRFLGINTSYYVILRYEVYLVSWEHAQKTGHRKLPHFDLLHFKIQQSVQKLV